MVTEEEADDGEGAAETVTDGRDLATSTWADVCTLAGRKNLLFPRADA